MPDRLLSIPSAAEQLGGVSSWTVRELIRTRQLGHARVKRRLLVPQSALDRYIEQQTTPAAGTTKPTLRTERKEAHAAPTSTSHIKRLVDIRELCKQS